MVIQRRSSENWINKLRGGKSKDGKTFTERKWKKKEKEVVALEYRDIFKERVPRKQSLRQGIIFT